MRRSSSRRPPAVFVPGRLYELDQAARMLGLSSHTLAREVRRGRLLALRLGRRQFLRGRWVLEWIEAGRKRA